MATPTARDVLLGLIDEAYDTRAWHGTTLRGALRGMGAATAAWRPADGRHNTWEIAVHCAYWKYAVRRRLAGTRRGRFALPGSDWFPTPDPPTDAAWRGMLALLRAEHQQLREVIARLPARALARAPAGSKTSTLALIRGIAAHDLYHAGQVQLLKRLRAGS